jgi:hypothetical protein
MLLPVLPGPEIILQPVHQKSSANSGKSSANFRPQILPTNYFFLRPLVSFLAGISATWQHWLLLRNPPPTPPSPPSPPCHSSHPYSLPADCSISQILKDDYRLPFCEIIILWPWQFDPQTSKPSDMFVRPQNCPVIVDPKSKVKKTLAVTFSQFVCMDWPSFVTFWLLNYSCTLHVITMQRLFCDM